MKNTVIHQIEVSQDKDEIAKAILHHVEASISEASPEHLQRIVDALKPKVVAADTLVLAKKIAGDDYSEGNLAMLELANLERYYQRRRELLKSSITTPEVAKLIGCQAITTVHDRRKAGTLLGLKDNGVYKFPLWQFDPEGDDSVIDRLPELLKTLQISDFAKLNWLSKPLRAFEGRTPVEVLKSGDERDVEDLIVEARGVGVAQ
ncbi:hypothetical protein C7B62_23900 [Pleurocapsa sp. CCALA 161]|uniref:antitoxin Xre/MbcA/ParS toxin-binding domain-containing protein n=1 Tax=Pleurocapsa sp. CCALA 161 TaxID=2107688 RepID=UPI000D082FB9|nr:antitoxin Xre/MbcA/ParS toxin-binding domain-containing protein [Pleurocapsa sp. CCALA 161]PSB06016.1 hypothetical protein C7B62_23900 [Pleurocapsa sp. CCALA 161]